MWDGSCAITCSGQRTPKTPLATTDSDLTGGTRAQGHETLRLFDCSVAGMLSDFSLYQEFQQRRPLQVRGRARLVRLYSAAILLGDLTQAATRNRGCHFWFASGQVDSSAHNRS